MHQLGDERQPLLPSTSIHSTPESAHGDHRRNKPWPTPSISAIRAFLSREAAITIICVFILQFLVSFAKHVVEVPIVRLFENAICDRYYASHGDAVSDPVSRRSCKLPAIQDQLAFITGLRFGFDAFGGVVSAIYYGGLADRLGRRLVLILFCIGTLLSQVWIVLVCYLNTMLPTQLVWVSSIFLLVGGGQRVAKSMLFTIIADSVDQSNRYADLTLFPPQPNIDSIQIEIHVPSFFSTSRLHSHRTSFRRLLHAGQYMAFIRSCLWNPRLGKYPSMVDAGVSQASTSHQRRSSPSSGDLATPRRRRRAVNS